MCTTVVALNYYSYHEDLRSKSKLEEFQFHKMLRFLNKLSIPTTMTCIYLMTRNLYCNLYIYSNILYYAIVLSEAEDNNLLIHYLNLFSNCKQNFKSIVCKKLSYY